MIESSILTTSLEWAGTLFAICGVFFLTRHKKEGFLFCLGDNVAFLLMGLCTRQWVFTGLMIAFMCINSMGYRKSLRVAEAETFPKEDEKKGRRAA